MRKKYILLIHLFSTSLFFAKSVVDDLALNASKTLAHDRTPKKEIYSEQQQTCVIGKEVYVFILELGNIFQL